MSNGQSVELADLYRGRSAFFLGAGPSLLDVDLPLLNSRGVLTCGVNNVPAIFRPHLWVSADDPGNFADAIWRDPGILKFVPRGHFERPIVVRGEDGSLNVSSECVASMPAVFGFDLNELFCPERWLFEDTFNWGNDGSTPDLDGNRGGRSVMFLALRLLFYLGIRKVFLLGCDFRMTFDQPNYAFSQARTRASVLNNNASYRILNRRLIRLRPCFDAAGFEVFNCTEGSQLAAFPFVTLEQALNEMTAGIPKQIVTDGMYDRLQRERDAQRASPHAVR
ncbi:MAG: hypothetical protein WD063_17630 [Pirellulales bacterium]